MEVSYSIEHKMKGFKTRVINKMNMKYIWAIEREREQKHFFLDVIFYCNIFKLL